MVVCTVPRIDIHYASILCVQLPQRLLQLLAVPQRGSEVVRLKFVPPAHDIAQKAEYLQEGGVSMCCKHCMISLVALSRKDLASHYCGSARACFGHAISCDYACVLCGAPFCSNPQAC